MTTPANNFVPKFGGNGESMMVAVEVETLHDHWWPRPGWRPGRLTDTWHLTFETAPALHRLVATYQAALRPLPGLCPVPERWLHLTVQSVGYTDQISADRLAASTAAVRRALAELAPFDLTFHAPHIAPEGVVLPPEPTAPVQVLYDRIRDALISTLGHDVVPTTADGFWPHVTAAYSAVTAPSEPYARALRAVDAQPAVVRVTEARLIRQERLLAPEWLYRWTVVDTAPIGPLLR